MLNLAIGYFSLFMFFCISVHHSGICAYFWRFKVEVSAILMTATMFSSVIYTNMGACVFIMEAAQSTLIQTKRSNI